MITVIYYEIELKNKIKKFEKHNFMVDKDQEEKALALIKQVKENNDSLPSKVETLIEGAPVGLGEPFFDSFESTLSHLLFSIPAVKAVSFGDFDLENKLGSNQTDEMEYKDDQVIFSNNHQGGIMGGLTNGNMHINIIAKSKNIISKLYEMLYVIGVIIAETPIISNILNIFEPIIFPIAIISTFIRCAVCSWC